MVVSSQIGDGTLIDLCTEIDPNQCGELMRKNMPISKGVERRCNPFIVRKTR